MTTGALVVDPRHLPVLSRRPSRRPLINVSYAWVLHRRIFIRVFAAVICCVAITLVYQVRDHIGWTAATLAGMLQGEFADAGFAVERIAITGQALANEREIVAALGLTPGMSTFNFDAEAARARIEQLPAVASATIRKIYPDNVVVTVSEKLPVARWRVDGVTFVVDAAGEQIGEDGGAYGDLPLVIGDGAADDALVMIRALDRYPVLTGKLAALSRIGDRRWDMIYETGLRVQLPELGIAQALVQLEGFQRDYALLDRDVTVIDLRVPGLVALKPTEREPEAKKPATP